MEIPIGGYIPLDENESTEKSKSCEFENVNFLNMIKNI